MTTSTASQRYWQQAVTSVARRVNGAAWAERFAPGAFAGATLAALVFYALRRVRSPSVEWGWIALIACLAGAAIVAWRLARRGFFSRDDARTFLEYQLRLDSRLSAAETGVAAWPRVSEQLSRTGVLRWKTSNAAAWLAGAIVMIAAGLWLPVPPASSLRVAPVEKPPALAQTEEWLKDLAQVNAVDPQSLEALAAQARELASKPTENQYSHSALEAADALREQTAQAMQNLARDFETAEAALSALERGKSGDAQDAQNMPDAQQQQQQGMSDEVLRRAGEQLDKALHGMREGTLAANAELAGALGKIDTANLRELSAEEAAKLAKQLGQAGKLVRGVAGAQVDGDGNGDADEKLDALLAAIDAGAGDPKSARGNGGVSRGRGDAPLSFDKRASDAGSGEMQTVQNADYSRAALGDKLGTQIGEHMVDRTAATGPQSAGALTGAARGGEAVWVNKLTPAEREALKEFYK